MVRNSIEKLDAQIDMLQNKKFIEKVRTKTNKVIKKNRKVILEETTITDDNLLSDLVGSNENTKVFAMKDKVSSIDNTKTKFLDTISIGNITINQKKVMDIYLPIFLVLLIFVFIILIIMI